MDISTIIKIILIILIVIVLIIFLRVRNKIREFSLRNFATEDVLKGLSDIKEKTQAAEKSLSSATRFYLPEIQKDFPIFNWEQYKLKVQDSVREYIEKEFNGTDIDIHRTEISNYIKKEGTCAIEAQTSAGYRADEHNIEKRFVTKILYIQDMLKIKTSGTGITLTCPNCGAPVKNLGEKKCAYCGGAVREINERVWHVAETKEG